MDKKEDNSVTDGAKGNTINQSIMSLSEACDYLKLGKSTMYRYLDSGKIKGFKYPGSSRWRFKKDALDKWITEASMGGLH